VCRHDGPSGPNNKPQEAMPQPPCLAKLDMNGVILACCRQTTKRDFQEKWGKCAKGMTPPKPKALALIRPTSAPATSAMARMAPQQSTTANPSPYGNKNFV
jgi:hypothetical protein